MLPLVSVIISSFNRPKLIRDAINSALSQSWPQDRLQIIVADDWSNVETSRVIGDYIETTPNISMVRPASVPTDQERQYGSRCAIGINAAMPLVRGQYLAFLPDDDMLSPNSIESRARYLMANPDCNVVLGRLESCKSATPVAGFHWIGNVAYGMAVGAMFPGCMHDRNGWWPKDGPVDRIANRADHGQIMVRCDLSNVVGLPRWPGTSPEYDCDDAAWFDKLEKHGIGPFHGIDEIAVIKRYHSQGHRSNPSRRE